MAVTPRCRPLALDRATVAVLRDHRRHMLEERLLIGAGLVDEGLVLHRPDGSCLNPDAVSAAFVRRVEGTGLPRLTLKAVRHTWATLALERGIHRAWSRSGSDTRPSPSR